jgi:hypothetical protein
MRVEIARRLLMMALSVALSAGLVLRSAQAIAKDTMLPPAAAAAATPDTAMPMPGKCDGCAGHEKAVGACSASCANVFALLPAVVGFVSVPMETVGPCVEASATGHAFPPDPYPPKPSILS